jgi:hypothetical protein
VNDKKLSTGVTKFGLSSEVSETINSETMHFWTCVDINYFYYLHVKNSGARGSIVVKALCYKPEGRGFETR